MKAFLRVFLAAAGRALFASQARSVDGQRNGFVIGGGIGVGSTNYKLELQSIYGSGQSDWENKLSYMTDFKFGLGLSRNVEVVLTSKMSWFDIEGLTFASGITGLETNIYLQTIGVYFSGGLGVATLSDPFEDKPETWSGIGAFGGMGYEFASHYALEFNAIYGLPDREESGATLVFENLVARILFVVTAY